MNIVLWILQFLLGLYFVVTGVMHFVVPPGLPAIMAWMYDLSSGMHTFVGILEILGGLGLILPGLTRIQPRLTVLAALGLVIVMLGATVWHLLRGEAQNIVMNLILAGVAGFIAYGRWRLSPLKGRGE